MENGNKYAIRTTCIIGKERIRKGKVLKLQAQNAQRKETKMECQREVEVLKLQAHDKQQTNHTK